MTCRELNNIQKMINQYDKRGQKDERVEKITGCPEKEWEGSEMYLRT